MALHLADCSRTSMLWEWLVGAAGAAPPGCKLLALPTPTLSCVAQPAQFDGQLSAVLPNADEQALFLSADGKLCEDARCRRCLTAAEPQDWSGDKLRWRWCRGAEPFPLVIDRASVIWSLCYRALSMLLVLEVCKIALSRRRSTA